MNAIATRFQVTAAALAVGATTIFAPIAANAAPSVQIPAAPVNVVASDLAQAPGDFGYFLQVASLQAYARQIAFRSASLDRRATRLAAYATANPGTFFGMQAAAAAQRLTATRASLGDISLSICRGGTGVSVGPYGAVTSGPC